MFSEKIRPWRTRPADTRGGLPLVRVENAGQDPATPSAQHTKGGMLKRFEVERFFSSLSCFRLNFSCEDGIVQSFQLHSKDALFSPIGNQLVRYTGSSSLCRF